MSLNPAAMFVDANRRVRHIYFHMMCQSREFVVDGAII